MKRYRVVVGAVVLMVVATVVALLVNQVQVDADRIARAKQDKDMANRMALSECLDRAGTDFEKNLCDQSGLLTTMDSLKKAYGTSLDIQQATYQGTEVSVLRVNGWVGDSFVPCLVVSPTEVNCGRPISKKTGTEIITASMKSLGITKATVVGTEVTSVTGKGRAADLQAAVRWVDKVDGRIPSVPGLVVR